MSLVTNILDENRHLSDLLKNQDKEIENLRELLGECKEFISERLEGLCSGEKDELLTRINAALGESEER